MERFRTHLDKLPYVRGTICDKFFDNLINASFIWSKLKEWEEECGDVSPIYILEALLL